MVSTTAAVLIVTISLPGNLGRWLPCDVFPRGAPTAGSRQAHGRRRKTKDVQQETSLKPHSENMFDPYLERQKRSHTIVRGTKNTGLKDKPPKVIIESDTTGDASPTVYGFLQAFPRVPRSPRVTQHTIATSLPPPQNSATLRSTGVPSDNIT